MSMTARDMFGGSLPGNSEPLPAALTMPGPRRRLLWVGVDLDGTIARQLWTPDNPTREIGSPIAENVAKLHRLDNEGWKVFVHTSRPWTDYEYIEAWLIHHKIPFKGIQCGKPLYAAYVDDHAINADDDDWTPK